MFPEPLWKVDLEAKHGETIFAVPQRVRAKDEAHARQCATEAANADLNGMGQVVRVVRVQRITE